MSVLLYNSTGLTYTGGGHILYGTAGDPCCCGGGPPDDKLCHDICGFEAVDIYTGIAPGAARYFRMAIQATFTRTVTDDASVDHDVLVPYVTIRDVRCVDYSTDYETTAFSGIARRAGGEWIMNVSLRGGSTTHVLLIAPSSYSPPTDGASWTATVQDADAEFGAITRKKGGCRPDWSYPLYWSNLADKTELCTWILGFPATFSVSGLFSPVGRTATPTNAFYPWDQIMHRRCDYWQTCSTISDVYFFYQCATLLNFGGPDVYNDCTNASTASSGGIAQSDYDVGSGSTRYVDAGATMGYSDGVAHPSCWRLTMLNAVDYVNPFSVYTTLSGEYWRDGYVPAQEANGGSFPYTITL